MKIKNRRNHAKNRVKKFSPVACVIVACILVYCYFFSDCSRVFVFHQQEPHQDIQSVHGINEEITYGAWKKQDIGSGAECKVLIKNVSMSNQLPEGYKKADIADFYDEDLEKFNKKVGYYEISDDGKISDGWLLCVFEVVFTNDNDFPVIVSTGNICIGHLNENNEFQKATEICQIWMIGDKSGKGTYYTKTVNAHTSSTYKVGCFFNKELLDKSENMVLKVPSSGDVNGVEHILMITLDANNVTFGENNKE